MTPGPEEHPDPEIDAESKQPPRTEFDERDWWPADAEPPF